MKATRGIRTLLWVLASMVVSAILFAIPVFAVGHRQEIPSPDSWLQMASGPLLGGIVAALLSLVIEYWPEYQSWDPRWKKVSYLGLCLVIGVGSAAVRALAGYTPWSFDPLIWHALWNALAQFGLGTAAHEFFPKASNGVMVRAEARRRARKAGR